MHGFVEAKAFDVRPVQYGTALPRHLAGIQDRGELDELGLAQRFNLLQKSTQRKSNPGNYDGPAFHAAMTIDALLGSGQLENGIYVQFLLVLNQSLDADIPRSRTEFAGKLGRTVLIGGELVIVVICRDIAVRADLFVGTETAFLNSRDFFPSLHRL